MESVWGRWLGGLILAATVGACARPEGVLRPVDAPPGTRVNMLTVTTRAPAEDPGVLYTGERGQGVSFNEITVGLPPGREVGTVQWPRQDPANPTTDFVTTNVQRLEPRQVVDWFRAAGGQRRRVFVYVHGFNTRFDRAVFRLAQLVHDSNANAAPVLFSWPSRGRILDYRRDIDNATYSRPDLAGLLQTTAASPAVSEIVILAHSMGAWVAVEALQQMALRSGGITPKIRHVILASPDLDAGVFRRQIETIGPRRPPITIFVSQVDRALQLSAFLAAGLPRLGAIDPANADYQAQLRSTTGITILDLTALRSGDRVNHGIYAASPAVVRLIGDRLIEGESITEADVEGGAAAVDAIGNLVAAPILVFEGAVRPLGAPRRAATP